MRALMDFWAALDDNQHVFLWLFLVGASGFLVALAGITGMWHAEHRTTDDEIDEYRDAAGREWGEEL